MKAKLVMGVMATVALLYCAEAANAFIFANDRSLVWNGNTSTWDDVNNWDNVQGADHGVPGRLDALGSVAYAMIDSGTATIAPGNTPAGQIFRSYIGGTGGATLNVSADSSYGRFYTAWDPGETGTLNLTAGTMTMNSSNFRLGNSGDSIATISGGAMNASGDLVLAYNAGSTSDLKVSGGALTAARLWLRSGTATVDVSGSGSTITVDRMLVGTTGHSMKVGLDAGGVTTINAVGSQAGGDTYEGVSLSDLAIEVYELPGFSGGAGSTYDIVSSTTSLDESGLTVTDTIPGLDFTWAIVPDGGNQILRLTAVPEPSSAFLLSVASCLAFTYRRIRS